MEFRDGNRRLLPSRTLALILLSTITLGIVPRSDASNPDAFRERILPLLEQYCIDCHAEVYAEAGVVLDRFDDGGAASRDGKTWLRVLDAVEGRIMPPADEPQPTVEELEAIVSWIERDVLLSRAGASPPPPVVMRRLNRQEYDNTIRDLLGLDLKLSDAFPADEIGFGFDNVGSALNVSPIHVEKYLDAAERAMAAAIVCPDVEGMAPAELIGLRTYPLPIDGSVEFEHTLKPGRYLAEFSLVRVRVAESVPPPRLVIGFGSDRRTVEAVRVQDETVVYRYWLTVAEGDDSVIVALAPGQSESDVLGTEAVTALAGGDQRYGDDRGLHVDSMVVRGPVPTRPEGLPESHLRIVVREPGPGDEGRIEAAREVISRFADRAFRRPATAEEVEEILDVFLLAHDRGESFERAVQIALTGVLVSPRFLYLVEPEEAPGDRPLNDFELASRLSYFLWSSMPDAELFREARAGTLREHLRAQVDRMLRDPKSDAFVSNFVGQWLQLRKLDSVARDGALFPGFDDSLKAAMREETERFFADVLRNDRPLLDLLDSDDTFLNQALAEHYGIVGVSGEEFRRVSLEGRPRGGLLTQASVLTLTSNPNRTSPVKRGQWILQQILGTPPPPPPPGVPDLDEGEEAAASASLRERLERHRSNPDCASCHSQMDPLGFALENFDAIGRWRDEDAGIPIDPSGELPGGIAFDDAEGLKRALVETSAKKFRRTLIENLMTYALGRSLGPEDYPTVEEIRSRLTGEDDRLRTILMGIVESPAFQHRGTAGES
ncbi:DUF1592 domain-containing protein [Tautonia sociabilis]|uniref:DUF1592 domain-containing protein n=1 Tax=Tautonia sociabilis TaxID=2080755 RepID=A0A432MDG3_9BACT|nr:DUF1592 domain-containing protein [Tautonia sociabilis]RUL82316.1 DUF1592 domain-containing protein [Tautonia sociabilis]